MNIFKIVVISILLLLGVQNCHGQCSAATFPVEQGFCRDDKFILKPGETYENEQQCLKCECSRNGQMLFLSCCSNKQRAVNVPDSCKVEEMGCFVRVVGRYGGPCKGGYGIVGK